MKRRIWLALLLLFAVFVFAVSYDRAFSYGGGGAFALTTAAFLLLVSVVCAEFLDYKVGGSTLSLERRVAVLSDQNRELSQAVQRLAATLLVIKDAASRFDGPMPSHESLIAEQLGFLSQHLPAGFIADHEASIRARVEGSGK